ncbi:glutathione S-transferase [Pseudoroseicyclus tamaricis]|uniref:Glutathione S-transferase n=1 Tax=Pseudoroseicyclus tamaricis TaxID=2705421 RepID=A0A6B2JG66_9RHOB|nr:glutathione S-transferase [Pseudoroseicyclus tamaricis]NDV00113.1 glutathione S-transferase [Pseudoroseicyclus tamaricis]
MTYELFIGDRSFSSWSLRGWLMFAAFDIPLRVTEVGLYAGTMAEDLAAAAPARLVPAMITPEGHVVFDTLAMAETLAERHPDAGLWPEDPVARAFARSITAEMHSGFAALRSACPMYLRHAWEGFSPSSDVLADLARLEQLWSLARERHGSAGPWLFGRYSLADVFYAPVATRIATYALPVGPVAAAYVSAHLREPHLRQWRAEGQATHYDCLPYQQDLPEAPWPA